MSDSANRTHPATPHKREEALRKGLAPCTPEGATIVVALALLILTLEVGRSGSSLFVSLAGPLWTPEAFERLSRANWNPVLADFQSAPRSFAWILIAIPVIIVFVGLLQKSFRLTPSRLAPDGSRVVPRSPLKEPIDAVETGTRSLVRIVLGLYAGVRLTSTFFGWGIWGPLSVSSIHGIISAIARLIGELAVLFVLFALADYGWRKLRFEWSLMMSLDEIRQEERSLEGDPRIRAELESRIEARLTGQKGRSPRSRPPLERRSAGGRSALRVLLDEGSRAALVSLDAHPASSPIVLAYGEGARAQEMREDARRLSYARVQVPGLAVLARSRIGSTVPDSLFEPLAQVHATFFSLRTDGGNN